MSDQEKPKVDVDPEVEKRLHSFRLHRAMPDETVKTVEPRPPVCRGCGGEIVRVPGGQGPTWVHEPRRQVVEEDRFYLTDYEFLAVCDEIDHELESAGKSGEWDEHHVLMLQGFANKLARERERRGLERGGIVGITIPKEGDDSPGTEGAS